MFQDLKTTYQDLKKSPQNYQDCRNFMVLEYLWKLLGERYSQKNQAEMCGPLPKTLTLFMT